MKILVTRELPREGLIELLEKFEVEINYLDRRLTAEELRNAISDKDGILCVGDRIDSLTMDAALKLKVISNFGVGYDNIDTDYATKKGIIVANTPDSVTISTAEMTWALILAVSRRVVEADKSIRSTEKFNTSPLSLLGTDLYKKTLGIIGLGRIGTEVAKRAIPFGMQIKYFDVQRKLKVEEDIPVTFLPLPMLLATSDVITLHLPLTSNTHYLLDYKEFDIFKENSILVNIARGPVINEKALLNALVSKKIKGAGLDVFEKEPFIPQELRNLNNVVLTPHIGTATYEARVLMARDAAESIISSLSGEIPKNAVNKF